MKLKKRAYIFLITLVFLYVLARLILPTDGNGGIVWLQWYRPIIVFGPILIAGFYDKVFLFVLRSLKNASEEEPPKSTVSYDEPENQSAKVEIHYSESIWNDPNKTLEEKNAAYIAMRDKEVERLNAAYDFNTLEGINSIPVPCTEVNGGSATGRVEYYLRGQCFARYEKEGNEEMAIACLKKAQELMFISDMIWKRYDFLRLVEYLYKIGRWDEAELELARIDEFFSKEKDGCPFHIKNAIQDAKSSGTDLVEVHTASPYCSECAKYTDRIYSISGRDKRFPKLPSKFTSDKTGHYLSCLSLYPYFDGISEPSFDCEDISEHSKRPFLDERTQEEIDRYNEFSKTKAKYFGDQEEAELRMIERAKEYYFDMQKFKWIQENLPSICPKSLSGFRRMRSTNSKNYQKLVEEAAKLGKDLT